jgi:hypothetical protein
MGIQVGLKRLVPAPEKGSRTMSFDEALESLSRDERFRATVYAMNGLLIQKGVYSPEEFERMFTEWAEKQHRENSASERVSVPSATL